MNEEKSEISEHIDSLCEKWGPKMQLPTSTKLSGRVLLQTVCQIESSYGFRAIPRYEKAFGESGYYFRKSKEVRKLWYEYGDWASCSYGPTQILFITATELGFTGGPAVLHGSWHSCFEFTVNLFNRRIFGRGANTLAKIFDAYNSGSHKDKNIPVEYIEKSVNEYKRRIST